MNTKIKELLEKGKVDAFFAYRTIHGFLFPCLFTRHDVDKLETWRPFKIRYPIVKLLLEQARQHPDRTYGVLVRGCEERAINELYKWNQLDPKRVVCLGQACSVDLALHCECQRPWPTRIDYGEKAPPVNESRRLEELEARTGNDERLGWWLKHLNRCIGCFGCRDVCPLCFCAECSLEHGDLVPAQRIPPDVSFHLVRAVHMAGRCIDCGLCEEICPAGIPLRVLYRKINTMVEGLFDYTPGGEDGKSPFSFLGAEALGSLSHN